MIEKRTLVLVDARGMYACRGAFATAVDGAAQFADYFALLAKSNLEKSVIWVRWRQDDPHWNGENDGAFMLWRFASLNETRAEHHDLCTCVASPLRPIDCRGPECDFAASNACSRLRQSTPLFSCAV